MNNMLRKTIISSAILTMISTSVFAESTSTNKPVPAYGDNPNLLKVLAVKTQEKIQNTAEKVGAATERSIAKIKPGVDKTKEVTSETTQTTVNVVKNTKDTVGKADAGSVPIQRGALSQGHAAISQQQPTQHTSPTPVTSPQVVATPSAMSQPSNDVFANSNNSATQVVEPEIRKQSIPLNQSTPTQTEPAVDVFDDGVPR